MAANILENLDKLIDILSKNASSASVQKAASKIFPKKSHDEILLLVDILVRIWQASWEIHSEPLQHEIRGLKLEIGKLHESFERHVSELNTATSLQKDANAEIDRLQAELKRAQNDYHALFSEVKSIIGNPQPSAIAKLSALLSFPKKPKIARRIAGWSIQTDGGYYRAIRNVGGKSIGVHLGRELIVSEALGKIRAKEKERGIQPLQLTSSDLAYSILRSKKSK
ncbi:MAG: hypothetical protein V1852_18525 [Pseudomonadota bacterium]